MVAEEEGGWSDKYSKAANAMWTEQAGTVRTSNGGIYRRFNETIKPFLINRIGPLYHKFLKDDGTFPSGKQRDDALEQMKQMLWDQDHAKKVVKAKPATGSSASADGATTGSTTSTAQGDEANSDTEMNEADDSDQEPDGVAAAPSSARAEGPTQPEREQADAEAQRDEGESPCAEEPAKKKVCKGDPQPMPSGWDGGPFFLSWLKLGPLGQNKPQLAPNAPPPAGSSRAKQREKQRERANAEAAEGSSPAPSRASSGGGSSSAQASSAASMEARKIAVLESMEKRAKMTELREARNQRLKELKAVVDMYDSNLEPDEWKAARAEYLASLKSPLPTDGSQEERGCYRLLDA